MKRFNLAIIGFLIMNGSLVMAEGHRFDLSPVWNLLTRFTPTTGNTTTDTVTTTSTTPSESTSGKMGEEEKRQAQEEMYKRIDGKDAEKLGKPTEAGKSTETAFGADGNGGGGNIPSKREALKSTENNDRITQKEKVVFSGNVVAFNGGVFPVVAASAAETAQALRAYPVRQTGNNPTAPQIFGGKENLLVMKFNPPRKAREVIDPTWGPDGYQATDSVVQGGLQQKNWGGTEIGVAVFQRYPPKFIGGGGAPAAKGGLNPDARP